MSDEKTKTDLVSRLQRWYSSYCNGEWEHSYGIKITTLDNPGWSIEIDLRGTVLEDMVFAPVMVERSDVDWLQCAAVSNVFRATGGVLNLEGILAIFFQWCDAAGDCSTSSEAAKG